MAGKPTYVDRNGDIVYRPPYLESQSRLTVWPLASDRAALQRVLDVALNQPAGGAVAYRPLLPAALLVLANIERVSSLDPRDRECGCVPEQDICFWILAGAYKNVGGKEELDHLAFYIPYIWVTNAFTMATGREVYGFPKSFGWANVPASPTDPGPLWADAYLLKTYAPTTQASRERIITLERAPASAAAPGPRYGGLLPALHAFLDAVRDMGGGWPAVDWDFVRQLLVDAFGKHLPVVFLKQFRDATAPTVACYQAIIEANATITDFRAGGFLPPGWKLELQQYAGAPILDDLALPSAATLDVGFWVDCSFSFDLGTEVWRAP